MGCRHKPATLPALLLGIRKMLMSEQGVVISMFLKEIKSVGCVHPAEVLFPSLWFTTVGVTLRFSLAYPAKTARYCCELESL